MKIFLAIDFGTSQTSVAMLAENGGHFPDGFGENFQQKDRMPGGMKKPMYAPTM